MVRNNSLLISSGRKQLNANGQSRVCSWTIVYKLTVVTSSLMSPVVGFY